MGKQTINIGDIFNSNNSGQFKVIDYKSKELQIKKLKSDLKKEMDVAKKIAITERIAELNRQRAQSFQK